MDKRQKNIKEYHNSQYGKQDINIFGNRGEKDGSKVFVILSFFIFCLRDSPVKSPKDKDAGKKYKKKIEYFI